MLISKNQFLKLTCETLVNEYGGTLVESGTDLRMAKKLFVRLKKYLPLLEKDVVTQKEFNAWRKKFKADVMGLEVEDMDDEDY